MNKKELAFAALAALSLLRAPEALAQVIGFEEEIPVAFTAAEKKALALSNRYYKEGAKSLEWNYRPGSILNIALDEPITLNSKTEQTHGITGWIYNEKASTDSLRFEFLTPEGEVAYRFAYQLAAPGWRACWNGFKAMDKPGKSRTIAAYRIIAPKAKGRIYLDRWKFPEKAMNLRTTPDQQVPRNNLTQGRDLWHWCRVWEWEQYPSDIARPTKLDPQQQSELETIATRLDELLALNSGTAQSLAKAGRNAYNKAEIQPAGSGFTGAPVVAPDEQDKAAGELSWNDLETMLAGLACEATYNKSYEAQTDYFIAWQYAIDQGFAYGSGMGTNHHYGYQVRKIYTTAWLMRRAIWKSAQREQILGALRFWAALQETRRPCPTGRDELLDSWNTLLQAKLISAMLIYDPCEREQAMRELARWVSTSLAYTPGTIGGIKPDGTTFHHGGFYPGYTTGVLAVVGEYIGVTSGTAYTPTAEARNTLRQAFVAMRNYCNPHEWATPISGRHPFGGKMGAADVKAFADLARSGDFSGRGEAFDRELAADYLRLNEGKNTPQARYFKEQGVQPAASPTGFFAYNYGAAGIHRRADWMVTLKGYNTNVWGAESYTKDNRYGRYQSYGAVQILAQPSRQASGYVQEGWDWNRLPGTTTIHLPFDLLNNPNTGTLMARSPEEFAGACSLEGRNGMFAMKLAEANYKNFTPDFVARKSVFCFDNRLVCLGTDIANSNATYPTETTLFQSQFRPGGKTPIAVRGTEQNATGYRDSLAAGPDCWLRDGYGNHYHVADAAQVQVQIAEQESLHEKTKAKNRGTFASAIIDHGRAPQGATYEYLVLVQPTPEELAAAQREPAYEVLCRNRTAHVVRDRATGITAYAAFEPYTADISDEVIATLPAEVMVMRSAATPPAAPSALRLSVCDPNLHIQEKTYTTDEPSAISLKTLTLKGTGWKLTEPNEKVKLTPQGDHTEVTVTCQHGQTVEFEVSK